MLFCLYGEFFQGETTLSYEKFTVDNTTCSRRFHIVFDDQDDKLPRVEVKCPYCDSAVFTATDHPKVTLARQENLVQTSQLSAILTKTCTFSDPFEKTKSKQTTGEKAAEKKRDHR
jgi:ribosomal protein S27AE